MMGGPTERVVDKVIQYGVAFAEVGSPKRKATDIDTS